MAVTRYGLWRILRDFILLFDGVNSWVFDRAFEENALSGNQESDGTRCVWPLGRKPLGATTKCDH